MTNQDDQELHDIVKSAKTSRSILLTCLVVILISIVGTTATITLLFRTKDIAESGAAQAVINGENSARILTITENLAHLQRQINECLNPDDDECTRQSKAQQTETVKQIVEQVQGGRDDLLSQIDSLQAQVQALINTIDHQSVFLKLPDVVVRPPQGGPGPVGAVGPPGPDVIKALLINLCQILGGTECK